MVRAEDVSRSLRGTAALLNRRVEGLNAFDFSFEGFWRSFAAIGLTLPAFVITLALERQRLGLSPGSLFDDPRMGIVVALGQIADFAALPLAIIPIARLMQLRTRYVAFVVVSNWISVFGLLFLSLPGLLLLIGWETPPLTSLFLCGFGIIVLRLQWFAAKVTLGVSGDIAAALVALGLMLDLMIGSVMRAFL